MTRYDELIHYLFSLKRSSGQREIDELAKKLNHPELSYPTVHVAGTNGKGSVSQKIKEALERSGYRVGCYTSPHIVSFTERIQVNGIPISEDEVVQGLEKLLEVSDNPKFFEITTALAFDYFAQQEVDIAIIEVGLGGRLDATNIVKPLVSVITSIDYDHEAVLGNTLEEIAYEKGGIIKENTPVVLGPNANQKVLAKIAEEKQAPLYAITKQPEDYEEENQAIAHLVLELLSDHFTLKEEAVEKGLASAPECRFQIIETPGTVVLDVANNPAAFNRLLTKVRRQFPERAIHLVFTCSKEKNLEGFIDLIDDQIKQVYLFSSSHRRLVHPEKIAKALDSKGYKNHETFSDAKCAMEQALTDFEGTDDIILATGSFFAMSEFLAVLPDSTLQPH